MDNPTDVRYGYVVSKTTTTTQETTMNAKATRIARTLCISIAQRDSYGRLLAAARDLPHMEYEVDRLERNYREMEIDIDSLICDLRSQGLTFEQIDAVTDGAR